MVLGILTSVAACPAIIGTTEAVRQGQKQNEREKHRGQKVNLTVRCTRKSSYSSQIDGGLVVLRDHKLYIENTPDDKNPSSSPSSQERKPFQKRRPSKKEQPNTEENPPPPSSQPHPFTGYFLPHPTHRWPHRGEALVSTIQPTPPVLNWIYVDASTNEVKFGNKIESEGHILGPWNVTKTDHRLLFEGWEGFLAVEEGEGRWGLWFDREDDGLKGKVPGERRRLEVEVCRREVRRGWEDRNQRP
ncbi:hypothetical protein ACLMJK_006108 [Lecanora helva]